MTARGSRVQQEDQSGFETHEEAVAEDLLRAKRIERAAPAKPTWPTMKDLHWRTNQRVPHLGDPPVDWSLAKDLSERLTSGVSSGFPDPTLAASLYMRGLRQRFASAALTLFAPFEDTELRTFTVISRSWAFKPEELERTTGAEIVNQFRTHLNRVGVLQMAGPLIAFLHGEFESRSGLYLIHFHGAGTREKVEALHRLKAHALWGYRKTITGAAPVRVVRVRHRRTQFSYLLKSYWPYRPVVEVRPGEWKRVRKARRIPEPFGIQVLLWLDRQKLSDLTLMNDVWSPRKGGNAAGRHLYLVVQQG